MIEALKDFDRDPLLAKLEAASVPASPINNIGQMFADPQTIARGMRLDLDDGHGNLLPSVRAPMVMSGTPLVYERPSPRLGEHTEEILAELEKIRTMKTGGQLIVDALEANGVDRIYLRAGRILSRRARRAARFADPHHRLPPGRRRGDDGRLPGPADRQARHLLRHPRPRRHQRLGRHPHRHAGFDTR